MKLLNLEVNTVNVELLQLALTSQLSLREQVGGIEWKGSDGRSALKDMEEGHLFNCAIMAQEKVEAAKKLGLSFIPKYHERTWDQWLTLFKAELEFRAAKES